MSVMYVLFYMRLVYSIHILCVQNEYDDNNINNLMFFFLELRNAYT